MAKIHGKDTKIYLDEFDITADSNNVEWNMNMEVAEVTGMSASSKAYIAGLVDTDITIGSFFENGAGGNEDIITDYWTGGETGILTVCPDGVSDGDVAYTCDTTYCTSVGVPASLNAAVAMNHTWKASAGIERMLVLYEGTVTATTNGESIDFGGAGVVGSGAAVVHLTSVTGSGTIDVKLQESSDEGVGDAWADESGATATQLTAIGSERFTWAGACEQYVRCVITVATFTAANIVVLAKTGGTYA